MLFENYNERGLALMEGFEEVRDLWLGCTGSLLHQRLHPDVYEKLNANALTTRAEAPGYIYTIYDYPFWHEEAGLKKFVSEHFKCCEVFAERINHNGVPDFSERLRLINLELLPEWMPDLTPAVFASYYSLDERGRMNSASGTSAFGYGDVMLRRLLG